MSLPVKAAAGGGVSALAAVGGYGVSTLFGKEPIHIQNPTPGKFGEDFQFHFMDASDNRNDSWWKERFDKLQAENDSEFSTEFKKNVVDSVDKLKTACNDAYSTKTTKTDMHPDTDDAGTKAKYEKDVWTFCSIDGKNPKTISEAKEEGRDEYKDKSGKEKSAIFVSVHDRENQGFWERQARAFYKRKSEDGTKEIEGIGKIASDTNLGFKTLYAKSEKDRTVEDLKAACENRYKDTFDSTKDKETLRFCSLQGKQD
ncbi:hypothetical protein [Candidatus Mycoplasma haematohominis]|uniref:Uncharacterized protein n=1 Tax=Candidatus Mycoplasma haematohominis TaxID=1494318 RepID=A0A478FSX6_9MOLU|nr:hypothetical protein [Candidatus Mycoplasma haemohominis]GCE63579.1 hypothetical protein MHSWG343_05760 [Candidatus Mycoplasma haemohominis]